MSEFTERSAESIRLELATLWAAHAAVGLKGQMALYSQASQEPWRAKEPGITFWFGPEDTQAAIDFVIKHYNNGTLPNSPLLLNPIVHDVETHAPLGSGVIWATGLALGVEKLKQPQRDRITDLGVFTGLFKRGQVESAGLKMLAFSTKILPPLKNSHSVEGCRELHEIANFLSDEYYNFYLLSGITYLGKHGGFIQADFAQVMPEGVDIKQCVTSQQIDVQKLKDASQSWQAYDRHHSLYVKFGINPEHIEKNLLFYNMCARDIELFDATGAKHADADTAVAFEFIVNGWIPRSAVTIIGATGGTGKSSLAHNLAVKCAIDYREDEPCPTWLGADIAVKNTKGLCIYFSGEDGPAIVHARAKVFDPEGRAQRLMFQRTDFGEGVTLGAFLKRLNKLPEVPLVVIDPARKYLTGDENDAGVVSEFFEAIEEFAIKKECAMVVVHHLVKGARPKHVLDIYDMLRGSQVFIDRARVVIGMYREGQYTVAGLAKNNIPPQMGMFMGEKLLTRDAKRLELVPVPGPEGVREARVQDDE